MSWKNFNNVEEPNVFNPIPAGTLAKMNMRIRGGDYNDITQGWEGSYATCNMLTKVVYLSCEFTIMEGIYAKRKLWSNIGLFSPKSPEYAHKGKIFIKQLLQSARNINAKDTSVIAQKARCIEGLKDLDNLIFIGRIGIKNDAYGVPRNDLNGVIMPEHKDYHVLMGVGTPSSVLPNTTSHSFYSPTPYWEKEEV